MIAVPGPTAALVSAGLAAAGLALALARPVLLDRPVRRGAAVLAGVGGTALVAAGLLGGGTLGLAEQLPLAVVAALSAAGAAVLVTRRRRAASARETARAVEEACRLLATELAAGLTPERALASAAEVWPPFAAVVGAHELGSSVPQALRRLAARPGAGALRHVAAAWHVGATSGSGLVVPLQSAAAALRDREVLHRTVRAELASARSTARLVAGLPALTLLVSTGGGASPVSFLLRPGPGLAVLGGGLLLTFLGLWWIERLAATVADELP